MPVLLIQTIKKWQILHPVVAKKKVEQEVDPFLCLQFYFEVSYVKDGTIGMAYQSYLDSVS